MSFKFISASNLFSEFNNSTLLVELSELKTKLLILDNRVWTLSFKEY